MEEYSVTISNIEKKGRVRLYHLLFKKGVIFHFLPGQFVIVDYADAKGEFKRSYSIASDPEHKNFLELCISLTKDGRGSKILSKIKIGDRLKISGPFGVFHLEISNNQDIILIAGGTGISPLRSMLKHLLDIGFLGKITLFYSFKAESDYLFRNELEELAKKNPNFTLIPTSTSPSKEWRGETAYVQDIFKKYVKNAEKKEVYCCGPVIMVDHVFAYLEKFGFKEQQLHREVWGH